MSNKTDWYVRPVFFVTDCELALTFYQKLGFREAWRHVEDGAPVAVQVAQRGVELILNRDARRAGDGRLFLSLEKGEVSLMVEKLAAGDIAVHDESWGMPVKALRDEDGNELFFYDDEVQDG